MYNARIDSAYCGFWLKVNFHLFSLYWVGQSIVISYLTYRWLVYNVQLFTNQFRLDISHVSIPRLYLTLQVLYPGLVDQAGELAFPPPKIFSIFLSVSSSVVWLKSRLCGAEVPDIFNGSHSFCTVWTSGTESHSLCALLRKREDCHESTFWTGNWGLLLQMVLVWGYWFRTISIYVFFRGYQ